MRLSSALLPILAASVSSQLLWLPKLFAPDTQAPVIMDSQASQQSPVTRDDVRISDVLSSDRSVTSFATFVRDVAAVSDRLNSLSAKTTVLAPLNSAIENREKSENGAKVWEDSRDYETFGTNAYDGDEGLERARKNLQRLVEAHVIPVSPWLENQTVKSLLDGDEEIRWVNKDGAMVIQPGDIKVQRVASKVRNGEVWIIEGVRKYK